MPKLELTELFRKGVRFQSRRSEPLKVTRNSFELHIIYIVRPLSFDLLLPHCQGVCLALKYPFNQGEFVSDQPRHEEVPGDVLFALFPQFSG